MQFVESEKTELYLVILFLFVVSFCCQSSFISCIYSGFYLLDL